MSQPQHHRRMVPIHIVHDGNPAERQAQAERVMTRALRQQPVTVERRKATTPFSRRRRATDPHN
jgi:hypothetical protein